MLEYDLAGNNLFSIGKKINKCITLINDNEEVLMSTEMNTYTKNYLESLGIYSIDNKPIIINDNLLNYQIKFNRVKRIKSTEYVKEE